MSNKLVQSPVQNIPSASPKPSSSAVKTNGVPNVPQRSTGSGSVPEVTFDGAGLGKKS